MDRAKKREKIFDKYSSNLFGYLNLAGMELALFDKQGNIQKFAKDIYFCPLCRRPFHKTYAFDKTMAAYLTLEDVPPVSCGGKPRILSCNSCNNNFGSLLDSQIERRLSIEPFLSATPNSKVDATFTLEEFNLRTKGEIQINPDNKQFSFLISKESNPRFHKKIFEDLLPKRSTFKMNAVFKGAIDLKFDLSLIKSAFLTMFIYFGFEYIMDKNADFIRKIIFEEIEHPLSYRGIFRDDFQGLEQGLYTLRDSNKAAVFLCIFNLILKEKDHKARFGIILPGAGQEGMAEYGYFKSLEQLNGTNFKIARINKDLLERGVHNGYTIAWKTRYE